MLDYIHPESAGIPVPLLPARREREVISAFTSVIDTSRDDFTVPGYLSGLADRCASLARADAAVVTVTDDGGRLLTTGAWPGGFPALSLFINPALAGPHQQAIISGDQISQPDLAAPDARWQQFAALAIDAGIRAVFSLPMRVTGASYGAVSLVRARAGGMPQQDLRLCGALADAAAVSLLQQRIAGGHPLAAGQVRAPLQLVTEPGCAPDGDRTIRAIRAGLPRPRRA
jgi:GAF domain